MNRYQNELCSTALNNIVSVLETEIGDEVRELLVAAARNVKRAMLSAEEIVDEESSEEGGG